MKDNNLVPFWKAEYGFWVKVTTNWCHAVSLGHAIRHLLAGGKVKLGRL